ncbi:MAG: hypothetical protein JST89_12115 [Cyanobacteria bacterium SZAS-4]|nr:hypothetical protein [Cyanobacteria bacterium SZAS-4]
MNNYFKASLYAVPIWWGTGAVVTELGHAVSLYRPAESGFMWANLAALGSIFYLANKFNKKDKAEDARLYHRRRVYSTEMEEAFRLVQLTFSGTYSSTSRWDFMVGDLSSGMLQYSINWYNALPGRPIITQSCLGQVTMHFKDVSDDNQQKTEVTYLFDTNANTLESRKQFREMVKHIVARLDHQIPNHEKTFLTEAEKTDLNTEYELTDGD